MAHTYSMAISGAGTTGLAIWEQRLQSYAVVLQLFAGDPTDPAVYPPRSWRHGTRPFECPTVESLANQLVARNAALDATSVLRLQELAEVVERVEGRPEIIGFTDRDGRRRLFCADPTGTRAVELGPALLDPRHGFAWGDDSRATYDTAAAIGRLVLTPMTAIELDAFALAMVTEHLAEAAPHFSFAAPGLCEWFLADVAPTTTLDGRAHMELASRFGVPVADAPALLPSTAATVGAGGPRLGWDV